MRKITTLIVIIFAINANASNLSDTTAIRLHLKNITKTEFSRNYENIEALDQTAEYIFNEFAKYCDTVEYQWFEAMENDYSNVIGSIGIHNEKRIIIGAHYDVCGDQEGADDNASGIVGLLELCRLLSKDSLEYRIDFVAYSLEEPPFFRTNEMGSYIHAEYLYENNIEVKGMVCLEMIGYFDETKDSQEYPIGILKPFYGSRGDYITVVQKFFNGRFGKKFKRKMKNQNLIKTKSFKGPKYLQGVDFSDHRNYWKFGYSAVMVTNTAFYRNYNYHTDGDTMETLDFLRMKLVIDEVYLTIKEF